MDIKEEPFETLDIVEVAMNNDNNEFRKRITNLENKGNMILQKMKSTSESSEYSNIQIYL